LAAVPERDAGAVLEAMRANPRGKEAGIIGRIIEGRRGEVSMITSLGSHRLVRAPSGEQLPRIC
ncbi:MAG: hydrogenase expression/formation protein HypE, partial [Actinobacteria bacterium]|nr:hydrogenase expression/formation protein HypE [Actinomycetota bacterium]